MDGLPPSSERNQKKAKKSPHGLPLNRGAKKIKLSEYIGASKALRSEQTPFPAAYHLPRRFHSRTPRPRARQNVADAIPAAFPESWSALPQQHIHFAGAGRGFTSASTWRVAHLIA